jgi:hypothetical protein
MASMPFKSISEQLSVLYDGGVKVGNDAEGEFAGLVSALADSGVWADGPHFQMHVVGCREYARAISVSPEGALQFRDVPPHLVVAQALTECPSVPVKWCEARLRVDPVKQGEAVWTWDVFDISDPDQPSHTIHADAGGSPGDDMTAAYTDESHVGESYPWRWADGRPFLPRVLYHSRRLGSDLWDAFAGAELARGSIDCALKMSMKQHCIFDASWPSRHAVNLQIEGAGKQGDSIVGVVADPSVVNNWGVKDSEAGQAFFHQFAPAIDIEKLHGVITDEVHQLAVDAGIPSSDIQRIGGTARSGVAISLTNEGKRTQQRRYVPHFTPSDVEMVSKAAAMLNRFTGSSWPETGWTVTYPEVPLSPGEQKARRDDVIELLEKGLIHPVDAYRRLHPGTSKEQAQQALAEIARTRAIMGA